MADSCGSDELRLIAQGLGDIDVAWKAFPVPRTGTSPRLYRKIQVTSRSAATRYAIESIIWPKRESGAPYPSMIGRVLAKSSRLGRGIPAGCPEHHTYSQSVTP